MKIICISGKAGHGKDTLATVMKEMIEDSGKTVLVTHYADLLKFILKNFFSWDGQKDERGRMLLQQVGTETVRAQHPNYWVDFIADILSMFPNQWDYVLIPDARFPNEINCLKERGFDVLHVRVIRSDYSSTLTESQKAHVSETALDDVAPDVIVSNDGSIDDLKKRVSILGNGGIFFQEEISYECY